MGAKKLSDADKAQAVLDLLQGQRTLAEICNRYGISPTYLYKLRDRALEAVKVALAGGEKQDLSRERQLELKLHRAKQRSGHQATLVTRAIREYNEEHPHSSLAGLSPDEYRQAYYEGQVTSNPKENLEITPKAA